MVRKCIIKGCNNAKLLHSFPRDPKRYRDWTNLLQRDLSFEDRLKYRICDLHFDETMKFERGRKRTNLITGAYPTLHLGVDVQEVNLRINHSELANESNDTEEVCEIFKEEESVIQDVEILHDTSTSTKVSINDSVPLSNFKCQELDEFQEIPTRAFGKCIRSYSRSLVKDSTEEVFTFIVESEDLPDNSQSDISDKNENNTALTKRVPQCTEAKTQLKLFRLNFLEKEHQLKLQLMKERHNEEMKLIKQRAALEIRLRSEESQARIAFYKKNKPK